MLTEHERVFLEEMRAKHLPGRHNQESHGNDASADAIKNPLDKLRLTGRIQLGSDERLISSGKIAPGFPFAVTRTQEGGDTWLRLGVTEPGDEHNWRGRRLGGTVDLESLGVAQLRDEAEAVADRAQDYREEMRENADRIDDFDGFDADPSTLTTEQQALLDRHSELRNGHVFEQGILAQGPDDALVYEIQGDDGLDDDESVRVIVAVRSEDVDHETWSITDGHYRQFDQDEFEKWARKVLETIGASYDAALTGDQPKSAKHLPGRHDQSSHGRHSAANRARQAARELDELRQSLDAVRAEQDASASSAARWMTPDDAKAMRAKMLAGQPWTDEQEEALNAYVGSGYAWMNGLLRNDPQANDRLAEESADTARRADDIIRAAAAGMRPTTEPVKVKRFVSGYESFGLDMDTLTRDEAIEAMREMKGKTLQEPGFMSTSMMETYGRETWLGRFKLELDVPEGAQGAYLDGDVGFEREQELLLAPGTRFEVTDVVIDPPHNTVKGRVVVS